MIGVLCLCPRDSHSCRKPIMWRRCVFLCIYMFALCSVCFSPHLNLNDLASCYSFGQFTVFTHWWKEQQRLLQSPMFATSDTLPGNSGIENTIIAHLTKNQCENNFYSISASRENVWHWVALAQDQPTTSLCAVWWSLLSLNLIIHYIVPL